MDISNGRIGARLDTLPMPTDSEVRRVQVLFDRGFRNDKDLFEKLVLAISGGVQRSGRRFRKDVKSVVIAKLINRLKTVELKDYKDDEVRLLEEIQKHLTSETGPTWMNGWLLNEESTQVSTREPSHVSRVAVADTALESVNEDAATMRSGKANGPSGGNYLPTPPGHSVIHSRAESLINFRIDARAQSGSGGPILLRSGPPSHVRRASEGNIVPDTRCVLCGRKPQDHYALGNHELPLQLLNAINRERQPLINDLHRQILNPYNALDSITLQTPIFIVQDGIRYQRQIREMEMRRSNDQWVFVVWFILLMFSVIIFEILSKIR